MWTHLALNVILLTRNLPYYRYQTFGWLQVTAKSGTDNALQVADSAPVLPCWTVITGLINLCSLVQMWLDLEA